MSEQSNPTAEEEAAVTAGEPEAEMIPPAGAALALADDEAPAAIEDDETEGDEESGDEDAGGDDGRYVDGPATYVERERGGRSRRIGSDVKVADIDYKNIPLLSRFLDRRGRILSRRKTRVSAKVQRTIVVAIKRARHLALLPYTADQTRLVRKRR